MNLTELKVARIRRGVKAQVIADALGKTVDSYIKRENGNVRLTLSDVFTITNVLHLTLAEFVTIFFDGDLPFCKESEENYKFRQYAYPLMEARKRAGCTEAEAAEALKLPVSAYRQREKGKVLISLTECATLSKMYGLSLEEFNDIFFRLNLPFRKSDLEPYTNIIPKSEGEINAKESYESCI